MKPNLPYTYSTLTDKILPVIWEYLVETVEAEVDDLNLAEDIYYDVVRETVKQLQQQLQNYSL
jgi:hypothetical protein